MWNAWSRIVGQRANTFTINFKFISCVQQAIAQSFKGDVVQTELTTS